MHDSGASRREARTCVWKRVFGIDRHGERGKARRFRSRPLQHHGAAHPSTKARTVFAAGMALTFIDRSNRGAGFAKDPKPELLNKLNHSLRPMIMRRQACNGCTAAITSPRKEIDGVH